jgi:drug/metabolite transporter (DMT)-like permease
MLDPLRGVGTGAMTRRGLLLFASMCVIWGIPYLFIRIAVRDLTPATLVFGRTSLAALVLLPVVLARGELRALRGRWLPLVVFAVIEMGVPWFLIGSAERRISSSLAGLLIAAVPLVATAIALVFRTRHGVGPAGALGLLVGLAGVVGIVGFDLHATSWRALAEMAVVAVCYAVGPAILARYLSGLPATGVITASLVLCAVAYAPAAALQWPASGPPAGALASVAVLAVVCTALAFLFFFALIEEVGPVRATVITYVNPAVAAALGVAALGEHLTAGMGIGFALVLAGSALATRGAPRRSAPAEPVGAVER